MHCVLPVLFTIAAGYADESGDDLTIGQFVSGLVVFAVIGGVVAAVRRRDEDAAIYVLGGLVVLGSFWLASKNGVFGFVAGLIGFTFLAVFIWFISGMFKPHEQGRAEHFGDNVVDDIKRNHGPDSLSLELENPVSTHSKPEVERRRTATNHKTAAETAAPLEIRGETKRDTPPDISRERALEVFHKRYQKTLVRWFDITDSLPGGTDFYEGPTNCWFVQFFLIFDDPTLGHKRRFLAVSRQPVKLFMIAPDDLVLRSGKVLQD